VAEFAVEWREWWNILQPSWQSNGSDRDCPADADWQLICCGGSNGIFIILMCLSWWGKAVTSPQNCDDFQAVVKDVIWAFEKISLSISVISNGLKCAGDNLDITFSSKCAHYSRLLGRLNASIFCYCLSHVCTLPVMAIVFVRFRCQSLINGTSSIQRPT
jgi:hypothetical protein